MVVLSLVQSALLVAAGALVIAARRERDVADAFEVAASDLTVVGVALVALGLVQALLAVGLARGRDGVRTVFAVIATLQIAPAVYSLVALQDVRSGGITSVAISLGVLWLLYGSPRSQEFFAP